MMEKIIVIVLCAVFVCVRSDCSDPLCQEAVTKDNLQDDTAIEDVDLKFELPNFKQVKNIDLNELNSILHGLTKWVESKLNESIAYREVNDKTNIFIKSFDFNVDFEEGSALFDVGLSKITENEENIVASTSESTPTPDNNAVLSTTPETNAEIDFTNKITDALEPFVNKQQENSIYNTIDFDITYYDQNEDNNSTDYPIIDYIDMYKDTTNEEYLYTGTEAPSTTAIPIDIQEITIKTEDIRTSSLNESSFVQTVFPWMATIYIKNSTNNSQFQYYCDGALMSEKIILTGGRCVLDNNETLVPENMLVFLGKGNLQYMGDAEKLVRIKNIILHDNFTKTAEGTVQNDLALLVMETPAVFDDRIRSACLHKDDSSMLEEAATTAWSSTGQLTPIFFEKNSDICFDKDENIFCATYGNDIPLCPSYGGFYIAKRSSRWCLQGILYGDPAYRGLCFNKNVLYTSLKNYLSWIDDNIVYYTNIL